MLRESIEKFAQEEIKPLLGKRVRKEKCGGELVCKLARMGLLGINVPQEYAGSAYSNVDNIIILEEISRADPLIGLLVVAHNSLSVNHINMFGSKEQKKKYLIHLASGQALGAWGFKEARIGTDKSTMKTRAEKKGDYWIINGSKLFIVDVDFTEIQVVMALTDPEKGRKGISSFILEKGMKGLKLRKREEKLGKEANCTSELFFKNVKVPASNLIGKEGKGYEQAGAVLNDWDASISAFLLGVTAGALELGSKCVNGNTDFSQKSGDIKEVQWMLADNFTELDTARLLTYRAAIIKDQGENFSKESAIAVFLSGKLAVKASSLAIQILGGLSKSQNLEDSNIYSILTDNSENTLDIMRLVLARDVPSFFHVGYS